MANVEPAWKQFRKSLKSYFYIKFFVYTNTYINSRKTGFWVKIQTVILKRSLKFLKINPLGAWSWLNNSKLSTLSFSWNSFSWSTSSFLFLGDLRETTGALKSDVRETDSEWNVGIGCNSDFNIHLLPHLTYWVSNCSTQITEFEVGVHSFRLTK